MTVFISGGCKNGKSMLAQRLAKDFSENGELYYIATMIPHDLEDEERIKKHIADRDGWGFKTIERGRDILRCLEEGTPGGSYLLDSVTALLSNEMFAGKEAAFTSPERVAEELKVLASSVRAIVMVSDFIYADAGRYDEFTENYRRGLAYIDRELARVSDVVVEVCAGNYIVHKGELPE